MTKLMNLQDKTIEVLIVEDEIVLALGMEASLEDLGYKVPSITTSVDAALKSLKEYSFDIVIMDINLKGKKTGIQAAKTIWKKYQIPIVFLTSSNDDSKFKDAMGSESYFYLTKPCRDRDLDIAIKTALHQHKYFFKNQECLKKDSLIILAKNHSYNIAKKILYKNDVALKLSGNEIKFFDVLASKVGEPLSFDRIISFIYRDEYSELSLLRSLAHSLSAKLEDELFEDVYEYGYRLKLS